MFYCECFKNMTVVVQIFANGVVSMLLCQLFPERGFEPSRGLCEAWAVH